MFVTFELHFNTGVLIPLTACSLLSVCCVDRHSYQLHSRLEQTRTTGAVSSGGLWASPALPGVWLSWIWTRVTVEREGAGAYPLAACGGRLCSHSDIQSRHNTAWGRGSVTTLSRTKAVFLAALLCTFTFTAYLYEELLSNHFFPQWVENQIYGNGKCHLTGVCKT